MSFIQNNIATILIGALVLGAVVFTAVRLILKAAKGRSGCACGCEHCTLQNQNNNRPYRGCKI